MPYFNKKKLFVAIAAVVANNPWVNAGLTPCINDTRVRRLDSEVDMGECGSELYDLSLHVDEKSRHVSLIAKPTKSEDCPWILYEASSNPLEAVHLEKQSYIITSNQDMEGLEVGSFSLASLQDAFENALIDTTSPYHVVSNNCASLPVKMMNNLDLDPTDPRVITYTADKLSSGDADLVAFPAAIQMIADAMDAYGVVEDFVAASVKAQL